MWALVLLGAALGPTQAPAAPVTLTAPLLPVEPARPPQESGTAVPGTTPPPRWIFMQALQGTGPAWRLDGNRMSVPGSTDLAYTASSDRHDNLPMGFNYRANEGHVQQAWLRFERTVDQNATTPTFGFRCDTFVG